MNDLRDELSDFARHIDVPAGSAADAVARARRRSQLTVVSRVGAAALLVGVGVVGVRQLSDPGLEGDPIDAPSGVANTDSTVPTSGPDGSDPRVTPTVATVVGTVPGAGSTVVGGGDAWLADDPHTRPAEYMDLNYTWTAMRAESPEALAVRFDPSDQYAIGTTDGSTGFVSEAVFAKTENGWEEVEQFSGYDAVLVGGTVYVVDDARSSSDGPLVVSLRAFDIASRTWSDVPAPEEMVIANSDSGVVSTSTMIFVSATRDALVADFSAYHELDTEAMGLDGSVGVTFEVQPDGSTQLIIEDFDCIDQVAGEDYGPVATVPYSSAPLGENPFAECQQRVDPATYGITDADVAAANTSADSIWMLKDGAWKQVQLPDDANGTSGATLLSGGIIETYADSGIKTDLGDEGDASTSRLWVVNDDASLRPLFDGKSFNRLSDQSLYNAPSSTQHAVASSGPYLLNQDLSGSDWFASNLNAMGASPGWGSYDATADMAVNTASGGIIGLGTVVTQLPTEPTELTSGDYTIRFDPGPYGDTIVTNNATGEQIDDWVLSTDSGGIDVAHFDSNGDETPLATFDTSWTDVPALNVDGKQVVFVSPDGVRFGAIDSDALIALVNGGPGDQLVLNTIRDNGGQIVVTGSFLSESGVETGDSYIFVGTPN